MCPNRRSCLLVSRLIPYRRGSEETRGIHFETYSGDHRPYHVHIYRGDEFIGRFDIENQIPMDEVLSSQVLKYLDELGYKKLRRGD